MPSFSICSRSRTSHSNWYSGGHFLRRLGHFRGRQPLSRLVHQPRAREVCGFRQYAAAGDRLLEFRPAAGRRHSERFHGFLWVVVGLIAVPVRNSPRNCALHGRRGILAVRVFRASSAQGDSSLPISTFRCRTAAPATLRNSAQSNFSGFPAPASSTRAAATPGGPVQQRQFQGLPRHLAGVHQISGAEARFLPPFEYQHNQRAGFNLFRVVAVQS